MLVWDSFLSNYNGRTCWQERDVSNQEVSLFMDAAGSKGFGVILGNKWCASRWPAEWEAVGLCRNLTRLEFFPIVVALELWGEKLCNKRRSRHVLGVQNSAADALSRFNFQVF